VFKISTIGIGTLAAYGFWITIAYFIWDPLNDLTDAYKISTSEEARRNKAAEEAAAALVSDGTWTQEEYLAYIAETEAAKEEEKGSMLDQIARSFGLTKQTLIWVVVGIILFSLLKG
jgi:hypothetical protein